MIIQTGSTRLTLAVIYTICLAKESPYSVLEMEQVISQLTASLWSESDYYLNQRSNLLASLYCHRVTHHITSSQLYSELPSVLFVTTINDLRYVLATINDMYWKTL